LKKDLSKIPAKAELASMLPGFRFLFAAIMLSISLLVFGLGAAALLRTVHEEFASNPSWRAAPETTFAQQADATRPVLAMLRVDTPAVEKAPDDATAAAAPTEQTAITSSPADTGRIAALKPEDSSPPETAKAENENPEVPVAENPPASEATLASVEMPAATQEIKIGAITTGEVASREDPSVTPIPEPLDAQVSSGPDIAATKIATLGGPPVSIMAPSPAKAADESAIKEQEARRAAHRRRLAARARRAAQQAAAQLANPFLPPVTTTRTR
jgi:hypothetical protein